MALIDCPECGRSGVSDSAEVCPSCGYAIKAHFDRLIEEQKQAELEEKRHEEHIAREAEIQRRMENVKLPDQPVFGENFPVLQALKYSAISALILIISGNVAIMILGGLAIGFSIVLLHYYSTTYKERKDAYDNIMKNPEAYKRGVVLRQMSGWTPPVKQAAVLTCPVCGSKEVERISTGSRAVSVATVGLASGKIGKQYKCKSCKHMW